MDRALRLTAYWNWLPAFRAVAETEHLPTAARLLHVSPSALSRTVRQLEHALGHVLFVRRNRGLHLTPAGREALAAVRDAMRGLDDRLGPLAGAEARAVVRVVGPAPWLAALILPVAGPDTVIEHVSVEPGTEPARLLRGEVDLALVTDAPADDRLRTVRLARVANQIAGGPGRRRGERGYAVWTGGHDGWPPETPRTIALASPQLDLVLAACADGELVAAVPVALARRRGLRRLAGPTLAPTTLYLRTRPPLGPGPLDALVARIAAAAAARA